MRFVLHHGWCGAFVYPQMNKCVLFALQIIEEWENRMEDKIEELAEMIVEVLPPGPSPPDVPNTEEEPNADDEPAMDVSAEATDGKVNNGDEQMEES